MACFQYEEDAIKWRISKFGLSIAEEKTKIIEFGRFAEERVKRNGRYKPEIFEFLGVTHYCVKRRSQRTKLV